MYDSHALKPLPERWFKQAESDLRAAGDSLGSVHYDWACFQAQQAAEKALKALLYAKGRTAVLSHSVADLMDIAIEYTDELARLKNEAKYLDTVYLATRYPNALAGERAPAEYYEKEEAQRCLSYAESILAAVSRYFEASTGS